MPNQCPNITLNNGVEMPQIGLGVYQAADGDEAYKNVTAAIAAGYRHVDTASFYKNEESVGKAIRDCGVPRSEIFVTTKVWNNDHGYDKTLAAFDRSLSLLGLEYVDLYLMHWPGQDTAGMVETWRAMEKLYADKKIRAIGVSNFEPCHLEVLLKECKVCPAVNQVEMHPLFQQEEVRSYCKEKGIAVTAWRPLGKGALLTLPALEELAKKHSRTTAQIILRWILQLGVITIPKSSHEERIKQNFDIFNFSLDEDDMATMKKLNENKRLGGDPMTFFHLA